MVSEICITTKLDIPRDVLWKARSSVTFMQFLVKNGALNRMDATPVQHVPQSTSKTRKHVYVPNTIDIPPMVKPIFDDSYLEITDTQLWDDDVPYEMHFSITPGVLEEYIKMTGVLKLATCVSSDHDEVEDEKSPHTDSMVCVQTIQATCQVDIPFVGYYVEQAILANMNSFYDIYPTHIQGFTRMLVDAYGDGTKDSLYTAVDRILEQEALHLNSPHHVVASNK